MRLVKFGKRYINFDNVADISVGTETATIYFNFCTGDLDGSEGRWVQAFTQLHGADVIALEQWLQDNSEDARAPMMGDDSDNMDGDDDSYHFTPPVIPQRDLI